jgi:hypothetical protein
MLCNYQEEIQWGDDPIGHQDLALGLGPKNAAAQARQPIQVPMIIGSANLVPKRSARNVSTSGTKPPKSAAWW